MRILVNMSNKTARVSLTISPGSSESLDIEGGDGGRGLKDNVRNIAVRVPVV